MKYVAKPVTIEAIQFDGTKESLQPFIDEYDAPFIGHTYDVGVQTREGTMTVRKGDWVIRGTEGEFYPCKDSIFKAKYVPENDKVDLEKIRQKILNEINTKKEALVRAWIAETGLTPSESVIAHKLCSDGTFKLWVEKKIDDL